jgi:hypothetical protein
MLWEATVHAEDGELFWGVVGIEVRQEVESKVASSPPSRGKPLPPPTKRSVEKSPDVKVSAEDEAARKLKLAKMFDEDVLKAQASGDMRAANNLRERAKARYAEIVKQYPNTKAAREAQELLDK